MRPRSAASKKGAPRGPDGGGRSASRQADHLVVPRRDAGRPEGPPVPSLAAPRAASARPTGPALRTALRLRRRPPRRRGRLRPRPARGRHAGHADLPRRLRRDDPGGRARRHGPRPRGLARRQGPQGPSERSRSSRRRPVRRSSTRCSASDSGCTNASSACAASRTSRPSSTPAATPGTPSPTIPTASDSSASNLGSERSSARRAGITGAALSAVIAATGEGAHLLRLGASRVGRTVSRRRWVRAAARPELRSRGDKSATMPDRTTTDPHWTSTTSPGAAAFSANSRSLHVVGRPPSKAHGDTDGGHARLFATDDRRRKSP